MGQPPGPLKADPPVPRQAPIPSTVERGAQRSRTRRQRRGQPVKREARSRPGHSINPLSISSEKYREKKEAIVVIKIAVAVLLTIATAFVIAKITKKSIAAPAYEHHQKGLK